MTSNIKETIVKTSTVTLEMTPREAFLLSQVMGNSNGESIQELINKDYGNCYANNPSFPCIKSITGKVKSEESFKLVNTMFDTLSKTLSKLTD